MVVTHQRKVMENNIFFKVMKIGGNLKENLHFENGLGKLEFVREK